MRKCFSMTAKGRLLLLLLASLLAAGCRGRGDEGASQEEYIEIKGSDTMVNLAQSWAEAFMEDNPHVSIAVTGGGSGTGIAAMLNGTTDVAISSRNISEQEMAQAAERGIEPIEHVGALDGIAVIVHPSNTVEKLTIAELSAIYSGRTSNWKDLGDTERRLVALSRDRNSGTHVYFLQQVVRQGNEKGPEEYGSGVLMMPSTQAIVDEVAQNSNAIGYIGLGYLSQQVAAVAVAATTGDEYVLPDLETAGSGLYPIARPLMLYTNGVPSGAIRDFIEFTVSEKGRRIVEEVGFVPAP